MSAAMTEQPPRAEQQAQRAQKRALYAAWINELLTSTAEAVKQALRGSGLTVTGQTDDSGTAEELVHSDEFDEEEVQSAIDELLQCTELGDCVASDDFDIDHDNGLWQHVTVQFAIEKGEVTTVNAVVRTSDEKLGEYIIDHCDAAAEAIEAIEEAMESRSDSGAPSSARKRAAQDGGEAEPDAKKPCNIQERQQKLQTLLRDIQQLQKRIQQASGEQRTVLEGEMREMQKQLTSVMFNDLSAQDQMSNIKHAAAFLNDSDAAGE